MRTIRITTEPVTGTQEAVIHGLPQNMEQAMAAIDEVEDSTDADWLPLSDVLNEVKNRYEVYAG